MQIGVSAERRTDICSGRVSGDEIPLVREVLNVQVNAPMGCLIAKHGVDNRKGRYGIDIRIAAKTFGLVIHAAAGAETWNPVNREIVGGPKVCDVRRNALRMF